MAGAKADYFSLVQQFINININMNMNMNMNYIRNEGGCKHYSINRYKEKVKVK